MALTRKQQVFIDHYLTRWNATEAAVAAGYSKKTARSIGAENLTKPDIQAAIQERLNELKMGADEVLTRLADQARSSMADFLDDEGQIDLALAKERGKLHLVKSRSVTKDGERIELYDAQAALALLGKHHGLFVDRAEVSGKGGAALVVRVEYADDTPETPEAAFGAADDAA